MRIRNSSIKEPALDRKKEIMSKRKHSPPLLSALVLFLWVSLPNPYLALASTVGQQPSQDQTPPKKEESQSDPPAKTDAQAAQESKAQSESQSNEQERPQRIVDPEKVRTQSSLPARLLLAPFRALTPKVSNGLNYVETSNVLERVRTIMSNPYIHPLFGSLGDGSGFGGGVWLSTGNLLSPNAKLFLSTHGTTKGYLETRVGAQTDPTGGARRVFSLDLAARYRLRPQEDFFGLGPQSLKSERSNYDLQERGVGLNASVRLHPRVRAGVGLDYSSNRVFRGKDERFATTQQTFGASNLPGLVEGGAALLGASVFAELDYRDSPGNPRKGAYARFSVTSNDSVGRGDFGFVNYLLDARGYIPLKSERRVLALRLLGDFNEPKGGSQIPFFRLARLGSTQTLRGFESQRFYGRHALASSIEYRYELIRSIEALAFTDIGQVFNRRSEFTRQNLRATFGGGLQFKSKKSVFLKLLVAKSGEGTRLILSFGPTF
jgi:hypothetical protein